MFVLILLFVTAQGSVSVTTQEFSSYNSCYAAKQAVEATAPAGVNYSNYRSLQCVAK